MEGNVRSSEFVGILPAAGIASRLSPCRYLKELLPVAYVIDDQSSTTTPVPVINLSLQALKAAAVQRCLVMISDRKPELMRYLGDGSEFGLEIAYVQQMAPTGLAVAVDLAYPWTHNCFSCLLLPDTIVYPATAMSHLCQFMAAEKPELALGVFPTSVPEQLGPVAFGSDGRVREVLDKPASTDIRNTWAMAVWSPDFSDLLHKSLLESTGKGLSVGEIFNLAVQAGMMVKAEWFADGLFVDVGTVKGLSKMVELSKELELSKTLEMPKSSLGGLAPAPVAVP
jgi:glucose-1-phosphate thymidylyltransferase